MTHPIPEVKDRIEEMTPQKLASIFHDIYETLAPAFGYVTRENTRTFDPDTKNGKLMIAVCSFILNTEIKDIVTTTRKKAIEECLAELGIDRFGSWNEHKEYMRERLLGKIK